MHTICSSYGQVQRIVIFKKSGVQSMVEYPLPILQMSQLMRLWYLSHRGPAKAEVSLHSLIRAFVASTHEVWK